MKFRARGGANLNDDVLATSILAFRHRLYTRAELLRQARRNRRPRVDVEAVAFVRHSHECPGLEAGAQREMGDVGAIRAVGCCQPDRGDEGVRPAAAIVSLFVPAFSYADAQGTEGAVPERAKDLVFDNFSTCFLEASCEAQNSAMEPKSVKK